MAIHWRSQRASLQDGSRVSARDDKNRGSADMLNSSHRIYSWLRYTVTVHLPIADDKKIQSKKSPPKWAWSLDKVRWLLTAHPRVSEHFHQAGQEDHCPLGQFRNRIRRHQGWTAQTGRSAICAHGLGSGRTLHLAVWADRHPCVASCAQQVAYWNRRCHTESQWRKTLSSKPEYMIYTTWA